MVSLYFYRYKSKNKPSFDEFVRSNEIMMLKRKGRSLYTLKDKIIAQSIGKFENLSEDLHSIMASIGVTESLQLPHAKGDFRKGNMLLSEMYTPDTQMRVANIFSQEINDLDYSFPTDVSEPIDVSKSVGLG